MTGNDLKLYVENEVDQEDIKEVKKILVSKLKDVRRAEKRIKIATKRAEEIRKEYEKLLETDYEDILNPPEDDEYDEDDDIDFPKKTSICKK